MSAIAIVAFTLDGAAAGWTIVGLVVLFGCARSAASVSYEDVLGNTALFVAAAIGAAAGMLDRVWLAGAVLFLAVLAYQGVRLGRSTHLVDMADEEDRAVYTAVSNTVVGIVIFATSTFGALSEAIGLSWPFVVFAAMSAVATMTAWGLHEVQT